MIALPHPALPFNGLARERKRTAGHHPGVLQKSIIELVLAMMGRKASGRADSETPAYGHCNALGRRIRSLSSSVPPGAAACSLLPAPAASQVRSSKFDSAGPNFRKDSRTAPAAVVWFNPVATKPPLLARRARDRTTVTVRALTHCG